MICCLDGPVQSIERFTEKKEQGVCGCLEEEREVKERAGGQLLTLSCGTLSSKNANL